jgi:hypothetical protein
LVESSIPVVASSSRNFQPLWKPNASYLLQKYPNNLTNQNTINPFITLIYYIYFGSISILSILFNIKNTELLLVHSNLFVYSVTGSKYSQNSVCWIWWSVNNFHCLTRLHYIGNSQTVKPTHDAEHVTSFALEHLNRWLKMLFQCI